MKRWLVVLTLFGCATTTTGTGVLERGDWHPDWSRHETREEEFRGTKFNLLVPAADAVPLANPRRAEGVDLVTTASEDLLSVGATLKLRARIQKTYELADGAVTAIAHEGNATRAYWTIARPIGSDRHVASELIVFAIERGASKIIVTTSDGAEHVIDVLVE